jgi:membrane-associated phospholipid phosphatase
MNKLPRLLKDGIFGSGWKNAVACIILAVCLYLTSLIYQFLNHGPYVLFLKTFIDDMIPIVPIFVIPYVSLDPFVYASLIIFLFVNTKIFKSAALSMIAAWFVSYAFYFFLQSYVYRWEPVGNDMFTNMIRDVYRGDNPFNCFPSLHTSISTVIAHHWLRLDKRIGVPVAIWVVLIVLSTLFVGQHYIADMFSGLTLAFGVSLLWMKTLGLWHSSSRRMKNDNTTA